MVEAIFVVFGIAALLLFRFIAPRHAVGVTLFAGWILLPVGNFPAGSATAIFPYWITGTAVPSDMLLTKMWWPPVVALTGVLLKDRDSLMRFRATWLDLPIALWCLWPIVQWAFVQNPDPQPWIASLYLLAGWGTPWLLGRIYFGGSEGGRNLLVFLVAGLTVIAPIALIEGILGPQVYGWLYEAHPFRFDGQERYLGFRPLAFFEDGNQYGIWVAATALAAVWLWRSAALKRYAPWSGLVAALGLVVAIASQSVGAICLLWAGLLFYWTIGFRLTRGILIATTLLILAGAALYVSGKVPLRHIAENTAIGRRIVDLARSSGRGSFTWRIARDQSALNLIRESPIVGTGQWDWWRKNGERPWGLWLLFLGQFGFIGFLMVSSALFMPVLNIFTGKRSLQWAQVSVPLAAIVSMTVGDALFNSFFFYPAIVASAALCTSES
jgi:hypothetical protein